MDITENGKYYIPTIEEFHTGFEYESGPHRWSKEIFDVDHFGSTYDQYFGSPLADDIEKGEVRVKYLDHEDIISLGWKQEETHPSVIGKWYKIPYNDPRGLHNEASLVYVYHKHWICIETKDKAAIDGSGSVRFAGVIKNKSELQRLMKQLGI